MSIFREPHIYCVAQTELEDFRQHVLLHAPALASLLDLLDAGIIPTPLEVMTGISQSVAYFTDGQLLHGDPLGPGETPPGRYCASC